MKISIQTTPEPKSAEPVMELRLGLDEDKDVALFGRAANGKEYKIAYFDSDGKMHRWLFRNDDVEDCGWPMNDDDQLCMDDEEIA